MASNVRISAITVSTKNRIFRAKRQLSLIPLNRTAALPAALSNLTRPRYNVHRQRIQQIHDSETQEVPIYSLYLFTEQLRDGPTSLGAWWWCIGHQWTHHESRSDVSVR